MDELNLDKYSKDIKDREIPDKPISYFEFNIGYT
jgi:hypothetical protein